MSGNHSHKTLPQKNELGVSVIISYITLFVSAGTSIVVTPFIIKTMGAPAYGLYMLAYSVGMYLNVEGLGIGGAVIRNVKKHLMLGEKTQAESFLFISLIIFSIFAALAFIVCTVINLGAEAFFSRSVAPEDIGRFKEMLSYVAINAALGFLLNYLASIMLAHEKYMLTRVVNLIKIIFRTLFIILLIKYITIETMILLDLFITVSVVLLFACFVFFRLKVRIRPRPFDKSLFFSTFRSTGFIFAALAVDNISWNSGSLIVAMAFDVTSAGAFSMAMTLCNIFSQLSAVVSNLFLPNATALVVKKATPGELLDKMIETGRYVIVLLTLIIIGFGFIGVEFLERYFGSEYIVSYYIALPLMISQLYPAIQFAGDSIIQAMNKFNTRSAIWTASSVLSIALSFLLTPMFGLMYSWLGIAVSNVVFRIIVTNMYYNRLMLDMRAFLIKTALPMFLAAAVAVALCLLCFSVFQLNFFAKGAVITLIYIIAVWFVYMSKREKQMLTGIVKKPLKTHE